MDYPRKWLRPEGEAEKKKEYFQLMSSTISTPPVWQPCQTHKHTVHVHTNGSERHTEWNTWHMTGFLHSLSSAVLYKIHAKPTRYCRIKIVHNGLFFKFQHLVDKKMNSKNFPWRLKKIQVLVSVLYKHYKSLLSLKKKKPPITNAQEPSLFHTDTVVL